MDIHNIGIELTDEQIEQYITFVEDTIAARKRSGTLLSTFDLLAGAMVLFFAAGRGSSLPAKWVFAGFREGLLPEGLLDKAERTEDYLRQANETLDSLEALTETLTEARSSVREAERKVKEALRSLEGQSAEAKELRKAAQEVQGG